ncbi:MAG: flagellar basal-body MS-ring/collar protein FliF [Pseudomonadota bacterium]
MENQNVIDSTAVQVNQMSLPGVMRIPAVRQILLLFGVAGAVAAGFAVALWSQTPVYTTLYADISSVEAAEIADALRSAGLPHKIDAKTGNVLVPEAELHTARMQVAGQGLGQGGASGILAIESDFGTSQFMETARYQHALEAELARTISSLGAVSEARVHLALPKQSAFLRDRKSASASVLLHLFRGRTLEQGQASAVVNLVAASVPDLMPKNVTVVDQYGSQLSATDRNDLDSQAMTQFNHARRIEDKLKARIEDLLTPLVGAGRVRAQVAADMDFTVEEAATESYTSGQANIISERVNEQNRLRADDAAAGVPGALSNQPPQAAGAGGVPDANTADSEQAINVIQDRATNYQPNRELRYQRLQPGQIRRLSVAVLVDASEPAAGGSQASQADASPNALSDEDLQRYTALVREAVGFSEERGDTVVVMNEAFRNPAAIETPEAPPIWEQPFVRDVLKQVLGALVVLAIAFGVVRPMLKSVMASGGSAAGGEYVGGGAAVSLSPAAAGQVAGASAAAIAGPSYDEKVAAAKNITGHDPARVAQVVKKWVGNGE